jgi:hypothetical protein
LKALRSGCKVSAGRRCGIRSRWLGAGGEVGCRDSWKEGSRRGKAKDRDSGQAGANRRAGFGAGKGKPKWRIRGRRVQAEGRDSGLQADGCRERQAEA